MHTYMLECMRAMACAALLFPLLPFNKGVPSIIRDFRFPPIILGGHACHRSVDIDTALVHDQERDRRLLYVQNVMPNVTQTATTDFLTYKM